MTGKQIDIKAICRLCLAAENDSLKPIFDEALGSKALPQKIIWLLQIQISRHDKLSTMVCNDCIIRLDTWFSYKKQCHRNQAKLAEWQSISKTEPSEFSESSVHIKQEPIDMPAMGMLPVKVEMTYSDEEYSDMNVAYPPDMNDDDFLDEFNALETDDDRRCPDCGKMFGNSQNRRRHQNMVHAKKERRAQMMEIRKSTSENSNEPQRINLQHLQPMDLDFSSSVKQENEVSSDKDDSLVNDVTSPKEETEKINDTAPSRKKSDDNMVNKEEKPLPSEEDPIKKETNDANDHQEDEKKIQFAAGLRLVQKDSPPVELEALSKIELSYIEKCKAMVSMFHTLQCACHNVQHKTLRYLHSHLRETRIWFPLFTCYNCMISLTDRSTFTKHHSRCPKPQLETLIKLSNVRKRSEVKPRLYQNFKCNRCKFLFSFHEDFCKHIDEDHAYGTPPFYCSCRYVFDSLEEYKNHCYTSCILSYYCDICFATTSTIEEFVKHAQEIHDNSEGFVLLQENTYVPRSGMIRQKETDEANVLEGKRERRKSSKEPIMVQIYDNEVPPDLKEIPTKVIRKMIQLDDTIRFNRNPTRCPLCKKQYSSVNNMMRHYRTHIERKEVELPPPDDAETENEDLYTCPDCGGVYPSSKWQTHLEEKHSPKACSDCDKEFQFQSELDQHRSVHLNLKLYRDSKTQAYKSTMMSPEGERLPDDVVVMCEICDEMFTSKEELKAHKLQNHDAGSRSGNSSALGNLEDALSDKEPTVEEQPFCDQCNKPFASAKSLKDHILNKHGSQFLKKNEYPKKCEFCGKVCTTGAAFRIHMQMHERMMPSENSEFPKKCEYCDKMCSSAAGLYLHTQMHERVTLGELKQKKEDQNPENVTDKEEESYHTCKRCFKVFGTKGKLKEHMKSHGAAAKSSPKKSRKVLCDLCHVSLDNLEALAKHKVEEHEDEMHHTDPDSQESDPMDATSIIYACDICEDTFDSKSELKTHKESHSRPKTKDLLCKYCKISFDSINELTKHMHKEHGESAKPRLPKDVRKKFKDDPNKPFKCLICGKGFVSHGAMTTHSGWHKRAGNRLQPVENTPNGTANARLAKRQKILKKIAVASAPKQEPIEPPEFQCSTCFMELPNETALQIHILEKHDDLDSDMLVPRCNTCNQDFATEEEYDKHKRFHDLLERQQKHKQQIKTPIIQSVQSVSEPTQGGSKRFPCNWCSSIFSRQDTLNTHIKNHHHEHVKTEFECNQCNRVFDKQNALTIHLKVHQKQKNAIAGQGSSGVHAGSGGAGKVYVCSLCSMGFSFPKDLRAHTISAHPF